MTVIQDAVLVMQHVGYRGADLLAALDVLLEDPEFAASTTGKGMVYEVERASQRTLDILYGSRVASLGSLKPVWHRLPDLWQKYTVRLDLTWQPVLDRISAFLEAMGRGTPKSEDILLPRNQPVDAEYVAKLHELAGLDTSLRLMFIEADDADVVYVADVTDEDGLDFMLRGYPFNHIRCPAAHEALGIGEFRVYVVGGRRIFRTDGLVASTDLGALQVLQTGKNLPRMASLRTASVIRLTFSLRAVLDPAFRDFLRDLGGVPASQVSWDIPLYAERDVQSTLDKIQEQFGHTVTIYQIIDTPEQNIYASAHPEAHVARVLSARIKGFRKERVAHVRPSTQGLAKAASVLEPADRRALEHVLHAGQCLGHYFVAKAGEVTPQRGSFGCDLPSVVRANAPAEPVSVYIVEGDIPQIVSADALNLDVNQDGHVDALEMSTMGLLGEPDADDGVEVEDDHCPYGHCPKCMAEGDYEEGDCIVCVNGCKCSASEWQPCDCGPLEAELPARLTVTSRIATTFDLAVEGLRYEIPAVRKYVEQNVCSRVNKFLDVDFDVREYDAVLSIMTENPDLGIHVSITDTNILCIQVRNDEHPDTSDVDYDLNAKKVVHTKQADDKALNATRDGILSLLLSRFQVQPGQKAAATSVALSTAKRQTINADLRKAGMDGNVRFRSVGQALAIAASVLNEHGYEIDDTLSGHMFNKPEGTTQVDVAASGEDPFSPVPVSNSRMFVQWNPFGDTKDASVICYLG